MVINSIYGIGEMIVKGLITPDEFFVFKPMLKDKKYMPIILKNLGRKNKEYIYNKRGGLKQVPVSKDKQLKFSLSDKEILIKFSNLWLIASYVDQEIIPKELLKDFAENFDIRNIE